MGVLAGYIIRRLLLMIPTFFGVTFLVFTLCQFVPGGPIDQLIMAAAGTGGGGEGGGGSAARGGVHLSERELAYFKEYYNFGKPLHLAYWEYVGKTVRLDLGTSMKYSRPVSEIIAQRLPVSIYYGLVTTILAYAICIPLGMLKAVWHRTWVDNTTSILIFLGYAIPNFALGAFLLVLFSVRYEWFPLGGFKSGEFETMTPLQQAGDLVWHSVLPIVSLMAGGLATFTMLTKNSLMENMSADYVRTALASGLSRRRAVFIHAMRNSLIPLATSFGNNISLILAGNLLVERVFNIPGIGLLFFESMTARDYPMVMGLTAISALLLLVGNLLSDLCVAAVDPRVRFS
jgi:microcin C transport system permease protein